MSNITTIRSTQLKEKYKDAHKLKFGHSFTDHMLTFKYAPDKGWHDMMIKPYENLSLDPACMTLHYGQAIFEGLKAYISPDGKPLLFRPEENFIRMNSSARRLKIPELDVSEVLEGLFELLKIEKDWIPTADGTSLYIRPTTIATDPFLGVKASDTYLFFIILSPVGTYYPEGFNPIKIHVEDEYVRAVKGGTGFTKAAGNYAASLLAGAQAKMKGFSQVLWLDGIHRRYCEEVGSMNIFFVLKDEIVTPSLSGSILPGITRKSILRLAADMGYKVTERLIGIDEVYKAYEDGELLEIFGTGTAAVVSPVGIMNWDGREIAINDNKTGEITRKLYDKLIGIQTGRIADKYGWSVSVE